MIGLLYLNPLILQLLASNIEVFYLLNMLYNLTLQYVIIFCCPLGKPSCFNKSVISFFWSQAYFFQKLQHIFRICRKCFRGCKQDKLVQKYLGTINTATIYYNICIRNKIYDDSLPAGEFIYLYMRGYKYLLLC